MVGAKANVVQHFDQPKLFTNVDPSMRGSTRPSEIFKAVLDAAAAQLHLDSNAAAKPFLHRGIRGDERAAVLAKFLSQHLSKNLSVAKGEAIDFRDGRSGQLDILIYDSDMAAPISSQAENVLVPAESLLAVIEVKTTLTQNELDGCYAAAQKVRALRPFKQAFVGARTGVGADDGNFRCLYLVFAYDTNISEDEWLRKEYARLQEASKKVHGKRDLIDLVCVLNRGLIRPAGGVGKTNSQDEKDTFLEFYLHLVNFFRRELPRRPAMDWQAYAAKTSSRWETLDTPPAPALPPVARSKK